MTATQATRMDSPHPGEVESVEILGRPVAQGEEILTADALAFLRDLHRRFDSRRLKLLDDRDRRQARFDAGERPAFLADTAAVRDDDWRVAPIPADLQDRRVEITGPAERKMVINALNSGASTFMADIEDSLTPTWENVIGSQVNLRDAVRGTIAFDDPESGRHYALGDDPAVLIVRPRGWHLPEKHLLVDGVAISGALLDFGLFFFHNAAACIERGTGPYFYLPKLENHLEARLWNDVFVFAQETLGLPRGTIRATVLIETVLAAFEMDEILYELRDHAAGLNCGRWDYIFSFIKKLRNQNGVVLPDRSEVTMTRHFLRSYSLLLVKTCHRRGASAIGGMAAQIPIRGDEDANAAALDKVREDKLREATDGYDGTWVAHPGLVPVAREVFDEHMPQANQIDNLREDVAIDAEDLLAVPDGDITEAGLRQNVSVGIQYLASWLRGTGCVPLYHLMEDAATAEISRTQLWQWLHRNARLKDGRTVDRALFRGVLDEELAAIRGSADPAMWETGRYGEAGELFAKLIEAEEFEEFLTLPAYERVLTPG